MHTYRKLSVWRKAHDLVLRVYGAASGFSSTHAALAHQLRRSAHSVPANVVDGGARSSSGEFSRRLQVAIASARELDYYLRLALDLGEISSKDHAMLEARTDEVTRMLVALRKTVAARDGGAHD
jgi:four helix bundle protein